jgi:hypothetical protein
MTNASRTFKGAIHVHTTFSHDGVLTLEELASFLKARGYDFMAVTEHSQDMTAESLALLEEGAKSLSDDRFLVIPGIEFTCTATIHILGIGVTSLCGSEDPSIVIDHVHAHDGLAVLAHPSNKDYPIDPAWVAKLDGCEIWNNRHGKWLPQLHSISKFRDLARFAPALKAYAGLDLHGPGGYSHVYMAVTVRELAREEVVRAVRSGSFVNGGHLVSLPADGRPGAIRYLYVSVFRTALNAARTAWHRVQGG